MRVLEEKTEVSPWLERHTCGAEREIWGQYIELVVEFGLVGEFIYRYSTDREGKLGRDSPGDHIKMQTLDGSEKHGLF